MDLADIKQKILELQGRTGMDSALLMLIALAAAVFLAVLVVLRLELLARRRRQTPHLRHSRKHHLRSAR